MWREWEERGRIGVWMIDNKESRMSSRNETLFALYFTL